MTGTSNDLEQCIHGQDSPCTCACPFSFDVREFVEKVQRGSFGAAFNLYRNAVVFPDIVWRICPAICKSACSRVIHGEAISLPLLEQAAIANAHSTDPINFNVPEKTGRVAVVGAGLSGLACAVKLAAMHYSVTVFDQREAIGGSLEDVLPRDVFEPEIRKQFKFVTCDFKLGMRVENLEELDFDAIYLSSGVELQGDADNVFRCASGLDRISALVAGSLAPDEIEWYLKTGNKKPSADARNAAAPAFQLDADEGAAIVPEGDGYTKAEARQEASRCAKCDCSACMQECVLMRQYGQTPKDLSKDVGLSLNLFAETQGRAGMRQIGSCNFCGFCKKICPVNIDIGSFLLHARIELCQTGHLPPAHHDFWIRDMEFSDSDEAAAFYEPVLGAGKYMFFPGCQAGGSDPRYVSMTYEKLLAQHPDTSLLLRCCAAPALWAGDVELFQSKHREIRDFWERAGRPTMVMGCPSCYRVFHDYLPDIPTKMVYEMLEMPAAKQLPFSKAVVFDPCSSRDYPEMQQAVRRLAGECGIELDELVNHGERAQCCSWGGQGYTVNPLFVKTLAKEQAEASDLPYITYCTNCRDIFSARGKECRHILDLINGINPDERIAPTVTERRMNRRKLKRQLAATYAIDSPPEEAPQMELLIDEALRKQMNDDLILEEDVAAVIARCEDDGDYIADLGSGHRTGHLKQGHLTFWVEYQPDADGSYRVFRVYTHRMVIKNDAAKGA